MESHIKEAVFSESLPGYMVRCELCPHHCLLGLGETGKCKVRTNQQGVLRAENYGKLSAVHLDPIEKKPLYHYYPGHKILSVGSVGCNLQCSFCQNFEISQTGVGHLTSLHKYSPVQLVSEALSIPDNIGIAYTYNEPVVFYEFMYDTAHLASSRGLKNVMVSNGYISKQPLQELIPFIDAFNIDLKAFNKDFFKKHTHSHLEPVLKSLEIIRKNDKHLEITHLVIPTLNDDLTDFEYMCQWIAKELGKETVLHLSRYFPRYQCNLPATDEELLRTMYNLATQYLTFVYLGNIIIPGLGSDTHCPDCSQRLVQRINYQTIIKGLTEQGNCKNCGRQIFIL